MPKPVSRAVILHGYAMSPNKMWFPWLHAELEKRGIGVVAPALPDPLRPTYEKWMRAVAPLTRSWDPSTIVIGHSLGGVLALRAIERLAEMRIRALFIVASPFGSTIGVKPLVHFFDKPIDWWSIREKIGDVRLVQAKDDPLVPFDHAFRYREALGAELRLLAKGGHFTGKKCPPLMEAIKPFLPRR